MRRLWYGGVLTLIGLLPAAARAQAPDAKGVEFFEKKIRPVLSQLCMECHSSALPKPKGGLTLDSREGLLQGGGTGPAVVPGQPQQSLLIRALHHQGPKMPKQKVPATVIADFEAWVKIGAPYPAAKVVPAGKSIDWAQARKFWAYQPPVKHARPPVKITGWVKKELDAFILAGLEQRQLKPVRPATKEELIRRATFDLIGLPPTPAEIDAFVKDTAPDAFAKVVDRLLASPHYGERWGRYWLDLARYSDDQGKAFLNNNANPLAFHYRDWVVQAFNKDMPYDRFVKLQIAGDELPGPVGNYFEQLAGLGFQGLGPKFRKGAAGAAQALADELEDRLDVLSRGVLGLTVACARCHDHKFDPIPQKDYYSLAAAYNGSDMVDLPLASPQKVTQFKADQQNLAAEKAKLAQWLKDRGLAAGKQALADVDRYLAAAWQLRPLPQAKVPGEANALAQKEKLHPYFLGRLLKYLGPANAAKVTPALKPWVNAAKAATGDGISEELGKAAAELKVAVLAAVAEANRHEKEYKDALAKAGPKAKVKKGTPPAEQMALLKGLWLDPNAPFAVSDKDARAVLAPADLAKYDQDKADLDARQKKTVQPFAVAHGIKGGGQPMKIFVRGNPLKPGPVAPPGFLQILRPADAPPAAKFTRLDLAEAVASPKNPLTARVFVNRVWHYHFGRGIVGSLGNFGNMGDAPTHPELLDTLAVRFMEAGWSVKWLHREIMLSATYQLSSAPDAHNAEKDADNHYLWRMSPRRLDIEAWRDALLAVAGKLDPTLGGPPVEVGVVKKLDQFANTAPLELADPANVRRTLYAKVSRHSPSVLLTLFDFPDANVTSDQRNVTLVPQQQLFVLNSKFMAEMARGFAARLAQGAASDEGRVELAFRLAYGRWPTAAEKKLSLNFLQSVPPGTPNQLTNWEQFCHALLTANEFMFVP